MIAPKFGLAAVPHSVRRSRSNPSPAPGHAAAAGMGDRHDAVDVVEAVEQPGLLGRLGDMPGDRRRTVHAGEDADIVAHAGASVLAAIAAKAARLLVAPPEAAPPRRPAAPTSPDCARAHARRRGSAAWPTPITWPYLRTALPGAIVAMATLWPNGTGSRVVTSPGRTVPAGSLRTATTTLSAGCSRIAVLSRVRTVSDKRASIDT